MMPFGETVLAWRLARGMTQADTARAAGIARPNLSAIERGDREVTLRTLRALAAALDVRPGILADGVGPSTDEGAPPLTRDGLERVAAAATRTGRTRNERETLLARHLAACAPLHQAAGRRTTRAGDRAYLLLKAATTPDTVASLVQRVSERRRP